MERASCFPYTVKSVKSGGPGTDHDGPVLEDMLTSWPELVDWAIKAGLATPQVAGELCALGTKHPRAANSAFRRALRLRDCLYRIVTALLAQRHPAIDDLRDFNAFLTEAHAAVVLETTPGGLVLDLPVTSERPESVLGPVVMAAARLLTSPETVAQFRRCEIEACRWFFVDRSKNYSRRWCDMKVCGNLAKAREYYRQHRGRDGTGAPRARFSPAGARRDDRAGRENVVGGHQVAQHGERPRALSAASRSC